MTTFRTTRGAVVYVEAPEIYVAPGLTRDDLIEISSYRNRKTTYTQHSNLQCIQDDHDYEPVSSIGTGRASKFLLEYAITENGILVNGDRLIFKVQFSDDGSTWYDYQNGPFGYLAEEESTTPCNKCVSGDCEGEYMRVVVRTDYTNANPLANFFTVSVNVTLLG